MEQWLVSLFGSYHCVIIDLLSLSLSARQSFSNILELLIKLGVTLSHELFMNIQTDVIHLAYCIEDSIVL